MHPNADTKPSKCFSRSVTLILWARYSFQSAPLPPPLAETIGTSAPEAAMDSATSTSNAAVLLASGGFERCQAGQRVQQLQQSKYSIQIDVVIT